MTDPERLARAIAKNERDMLQLIDERDAAEEALSQAYYIVIGRSPEWSNKFGHAQALEEIGDACEVLKQAARPSPETEAEVEAQDAALLLRWLKREGDGNLPDQLRLNADCDTYENNCNLRVEAAREITRLRAALSAMSPRGGYTGNATGKMLEAARLAEHNHFWPNTPPTAHTWTSLPSMLVAKLWRAMVDATPESPRGGWQPIETAPKDGRHIIFGRTPPWSATSNVCVGFWHQGRWQSINGGGQIVEEHWAYWTPHLDEPQP